MVSVRSVSDYLKVKVWYRSEKSWYQIADILDNYFGTILDFNL